MYKDVAQNYEAVLTDVFILHFEYFSVYMAYIEMNVRPKEDGLIVWAFLP